MKVLQIAGLHLLRTCSYSLCSLVFTQKHFVAGQIARSVFEHKKREAACLRIQAELRCHLARKFYLELYSSVVKIESGMRGMAARRELHFRRQMRAATIIQVNPWLN